MSNPSGDPKTGLLGCSDAPCESRQIGKTFFEPSQPPRPGERIDECRSRLSAFSASCPTCDPHETRCLGLFPKCRVFLFSLCHRGGVFHVEPGVRRCGMVYWPCLNRLGPVGRVGRVPRMSIRGVKSPAAVSPASAGGPDGVQSHDRRSERRWSSDNRRDLFRYQWYRGALPVIV